MKNDDHKWDNKHPTAQMLGRWQPWHAGHQKLFEEILKKTGQVNIMVRDVQGVDDNPFEFDTVKCNIEKALEQSNPFSLMHMFMIDLMLEKILLTELTCKPLSKSQSRNFPASFVEYKDKDLLPKRSVT